MSAAMQKIEVETVAGQQYIPAPGGWEFDRATGKIWWRLLNMSRDKQRLLGKARSPGRQRDLVRLEGGIETLGQVLADLLGMAAHYWVMEAQKPIYHGGA